MIINIPFYLGENYTKILSKHGLFMFEKHVSRSKFYKKSGFLINSSFYTISIDARIFYRDM
jgi:hypothetical protein